MEKKRKQEDKRSRRIARKSADPSLPVMEDDSEGVEGDDDLVSSDDSFVDDASTEDVNR